MRASRTPATTRPALTADTAFSAEPLAPLNASRLPPPPSFPTSVERIQRIRRGVFRSVIELQMAINDYLEQHNSDPKPFVWTASASSIIERVNRGKQALESQH